MERKFKINIIEIEQIRRLFSWKANNKQLQNWEIGLGLCFYHLSQL